MTTPTPTDRAIRGLVLAGGQSRRMGRDKAALEWAGGTLLSHAVALLGRAGAARVWVSGNHAAYRGIPDALPGLGPLGGLASALAVIPDGLLWVIPVDMPLLSVALLHRLRDAGPGSVRIFAEYPLPMCLKIDSTCRKVLASMCGDVDGTRSVRALQQRLGVVEVPVAARELPRLVNCNTPQQWRELAP